MEWAWRGRSEKNPCGPKEDKEGNGDWSGGIPGTRSDEKRGTRPGGEPGSL